jgi:hypothetical protein
MSLSEIGAFVREKMQAQEIQPGDNRPSALTEVPLLFVQNYEGDLNFIRPAVRAPSRELEPFAIARGVGWCEMEFIDAKQVEQQDTFLLLDLRNHHRGERRFLDSIGYDQHLNKALPRVLLATSPEDTLGWKGVNPKQCWQLRRCQTSEDLSAAIRSFLRLCTMFAKGQDEKNAALDTGRDHALSGRTHKD